uniref:Immunoglobulin V-set domain-containing protein n=1 Tax=Cyprinus carpio TaxID=7962 RepID=A0A8C1R8P7_CYPCA
MDIRTTDSGVYTLQIICSSSSSSKTINVAVTGESFNECSLYIFKIFSLSFWSVAYTLQLHFIIKPSQLSVCVSGVSATERNQIRHVINGESVTLEYVETKVKYYSIKWYYNDNLIAESTGVRSKICTDDQCKERFRNRLKLNQTTGSLNITNMNITDSGLYQLQIIISHSSHCITRVKRFNVTVFCEYISDAVLNLGICVIVVFLLMSATVTAGVIYCRQKKYKPQIMKMRMMLISRRRIRKTLLRGLGMTLNQTQDEAGYKLV